jgi:lipid-A-disaccharide synthase
MAEKGKLPVVMLVAAEASGDNLGAGLAAALKAKLDGRVKLVGVGGPRMAEAGVASPFDIAELSVLGYLEGLMAWRRVVRRADETAALAAREQPDIAVLIDSWGFTMRVAARLRKLDPSITLIKYVGPQVWASRPGRAKVLAAAVDSLLTLHKFDAPMFEAEGLKTTFVGNPALAKDFSRADPARLRQAIGAGPDDPILLVLPGSRPSEIARMSPPFGEAAALLKAERPSLRIVVPAASTVAASVKAAVAAWPIEAHVVEAETLKDDAFVAATAAIACSGTVTTELALAGVPMVVGYRIGAVTHFLLKRMIRTSWITLFNIAARRMIAPELIQDACTPENLARATAPLLDDPLRRKAQVAEQADALELMGRGGPDPSDAAADAVIAALKTRQHDGSQQKSPPNQ